METEKKENRKKLTRPEELFLSILTMGAYAWMPFIIGIFFIDDNMGIMGFTIIYVSLLFFSLLYIRKRIGAFSGLKKNQTLKIGCIITIIVQDILFLYLFLFQFLQSKESLFISLLISLFILIGSVELLGIRKEKQTI